MREECKQAEAEAKKNTDIIKAEIHQIKVEYEDIKTERDQAKNDLILSNQELESARA